MFCRYCGASIDVEASFCSSCGKPVGSSETSSNSSQTSETVNANDVVSSAAGAVKEFAQAVQNAAQGEQVQQLQSNMKAAKDQLASAATSQGKVAEKKLSNMTGSKKMTMIVIAAAVVVLAALSCFAFVSCSSGGADGVAKAAEKAYVKCDEQSYYKYLSPGYLDYMVGSDGWYGSDSEFKDDLKDFMQEDMDEIEWDCGDGCTIKVEDARVIKRCSGGTLNDVQDELEYDYDYKAGSVSDAAEVEVTLRARGPEGSRTYYKTYYCVKVGGKWYVHPPEIYSL